MFTCLHNTARIFVNSTIEPTYVIGSMIIKCYKVLKGITTLYKFDEKTTKSQKAILTNLKS